MREADLPSVAALTGALGYSPDVDRLRARFQRIHADAQQVLFVAEHDGAIAGWIHVHPVTHLESDAYAEIGGLVVDSRHRRLGIGRALVAEAERFAKGQGFTRVRVRSNVKRPEAHAFYPGVGFRAVKTQVNYEKDL